MISKDDPFLTEEDLVARYRQTVSAGTLRNWRVKQIGPPYVKIGRAILYPRATLEAWEQTQTVDTSDKS